MKKLFAAICAAFALFTAACAPNNNDINKYGEYCVEEIGKPCKSIDFISIQRREKDDYVYHYIITTENGDIYYCQALVDNNDELMYIDCDLYQKGES